MHHRARFDNLREHHVRRRSIAPCCEKLDRVVRRRDKPERLDAADGSRRVMKCMVEHFAADSQFVGLVDTAHQTPFDETDDGIPRRAVVHAGGARELAQRERIASSRQDEEQPLADMSTSGT